MIILQETAQDFARAFDSGKVHARQLYSYWMKRGSLEGFEVEPQARALVDEMVRKVDFGLVELSVVEESEGTVKFAVLLEDGLECESVLIPMESGMTLCVSSQVGCKMGCTFCETGRMGLIRSLSVAEIVGQLFFAKHRYGAKVRNVVFMGMGEPFDNLEAVVRAIEVMTDDSGLALGPSRISVSTSGRVEEICTFMERANPAVNLAVSVNAPTDEIRRKIMPINRTWDLAALKEAMAAYCHHPRRTIFIEYVLLKDLNDSLECADLLAGYLEGLRVKVNLIPYNPQRRSRFAPPEKAVMEAFSDRVRQRGYQVFLRQEKGQKIMAACGQLRRKRKQLSLEVEGSFR